MVDEIELAFNAYDAVKAKLEVVENDELIELEAHDALNDDVAYDACID
jgi:hypothetical protein